MKTTLISLLLVGSLASAQAAPYPFADAFEGGLAAWSSNGTWGVTATAAWSPPHAACDSPGAFYTNNTLALLALASLNTLLAPSQSWLLLSFILLGAASSGDGVSGLNIILEFAAPEDRPTYIGLTNTLLALPIVLAPILGGWLATVAGFPALLGAAALLADRAEAIGRLFVAGRRHSSG